MREPQRVKVLIGADSVANCQNGLDSAAGSAKEARDPKTQAILPIFGKVKNAVKGDMSTVDVLKNDKLGLALAAFRCGIGDEFDIHKLRYHKIILMSDADVDGSHIQILWTSFIWRYMPDIIEHGYLYVPKPPLFKAAKKGQKNRWFYTAEDLKKANLDSSWILARYKGLGEMNSDELWDTTMDPEQRILCQIKSTDAEKAEAMVELCMGQAVQPRKEMILNEVFAA